MRRPRPSRPQFTPSMTRLGRALFRGRADTRVGLYTQRSHLPAAFLEGLARGVILLNEFVAKKTLAAHDAVITALTMADPVSLLFSAYWSNFLVGREKRHTFLLFGALGRLTFLLLLFVRGPVGFATVLVVATLMIGAIIPAQNALFQTNYDQIERGRVYGVATSAQALATIGAALVAGRLYDHHPGSWRFVYVAAGLSGFASCWAFYRIRFRNREGVRLRPAARGRDLLREVRRTLRAPFAGSLAVLRGDPAFLRYEAAYMSYGLAFMMLQPVIPIFLVERIGVDYTQASNARGLVFYAMMVVFSPVFGRMLDRSDPVKVSLFAFLLLSLFPAGLMLAETVKGVYSAFAVYGIAMAAVNLGWTMGPIHFAARRDSAAYMGSHVALVGVRGLVGGPIGIAIYRSTGTPAAVLGLASALFLGGAMIMWSLDRRTAA